MRKQLFRGLAAILLALVVSSCLVTNDKQMNAMLGKPIDVAIQELGAPKRVTQAANGYVYTWAWRTQVDWRLWEVVDVWTDHARIINRWSRRCE